MAELVNNKFIGSGVTFPIELDIDNKPMVSNDLKLIRSSIGVILNWPSNFRWFNESFGSRIEELIEEPDDAVSRALLKHFIYEALDQWEKRIIVKDVTVEETQSNGRVNAYITYQVRNTKIEETVIYPFYKDLKY